MSGSRRIRMTQMLVLAVGLALVLAACAAGPNAAAAGGPGVPGFWLGLWHGLISPITFVVSLFNHDVNLYEIHNNGGWYNFGFMLGVSAVFSGGAGSGQSMRGRSRRRPV